PVLRPASRDKREMTPTQQTVLKDMVGRKKKTTRRKTKEVSAETEHARKKTTDVEVVPATAVPPDEEDTAALIKPPVAAPPESEPSQSRARADDPAIGRRIAEGKYVIESLIGSGAAGAVYRATHRELRRTVAIKLLHPHYQQDPQFMTSFRGEALAA